MTEVRENKTISFSPPKLLAFLLLVILTTTCVSARGVFSLRGGGDGDPIITYQQDYITDINVGGNAESVENKGEGETRNTELGNATVDEGKVSTEEREDEEFSLSPQQQQQTEVQYTAAVLEYASYSNWEDGGLAILQENAKAYLEYATLAKQQVN